MTRGEALDGIVTVGVEFFDAPEKVERFLAMPADEQAELVASMKLAGKAPGASVLPKLLAAFGLLAAVAGDVSGVAGAVSALRAL